MFGNVGQFIPDSLSVGGNVPRHSIELSATPTNASRQILSFNQNGSCFWNGREITGDDEFREAIITINRSLSSSMMSENDRVRNAEEIIANWMSMFSSKINRLNNLVDEHRMALNVEAKFREEGYYALCRNVNYYFVVKSIAEGVSQEVYALYINSEMRPFDHDALMSNIDSFFDSLIAHENEDFNRKRLEIGEWAI